MTTEEPPSWAALFERAPAHISEATIREVLADRRTPDDPEPADGGSDVMRDDATDDGSDERPDDATRDSRPTDGGGDD